ncbi:exodeoxyribonuclease VII large subunit [Hydrogenophaga sp. 5NK40-0174]|uniref:exodeoxyribonuclease VII large subunit n=1 Tax=Hydrogenophaga sp. 5NK40-0174 TaxID=3127649 RepID=UPI00333F686D
MNDEFLNEAPVSTRRVWGVGPLLRAIADALSARFNPVVVRGEISGFARAASGHCYFSLKDEGGQLRCAMFRRSATGLQFSPREGQMVEAVGRLDVYGARGDLQLIVESLEQAGQGALYEQFLRLKAKLEGEGLFDAARKRDLPVRPRSIALVTSAGAAALRDVATALRRRAPHVPVMLFPAAVQGQSAPREICAALDKAYRRYLDSGEGDVLLLVRGGGSLEDLWSFNDEQVVRTIARSPMPVLCGVGHETDFTLSDFVADVRAPTPTAAAEMASPTRLEEMDRLEALSEQLQAAVWGQLDMRAQRLDQLGMRLGKPSSRVHEAQRRLADLSHGLQQSVAVSLERDRARLAQMGQRMPKAVGWLMERQAARLDRLGGALKHLDPQLVLARGFSYLTDSEGQTITSVVGVTEEQSVTARLSDGVLDLGVKKIHRDKP